MMGTANWDALAEAYSRMSPSLVRRLCPEIADRRAAPTEVSAGGGWRSTQAVVDCGRRNSRHLRAVNSKLGGSSTPRHHPFVASFVAI